jgi:hypothetical protein
MKLTEWLGVAGFALAVVSLLINLGLTWLKWPRIAVEVGKGMRISPPAATIEVSPEQLAALHASAVNDDSASETVPGETAEPPPGDIFVLTVINNGSDPITIKSVGFVGGAGKNLQRLDALEAARSPAGESPPKTVVDRKPAIFPVRIDGHDCLIYEFDENALVTLASGVQYRGYADRYKSFRWWPKCGRSTVRRVWSEETVLRQGIQ